ncbi:hypothetical protein [Thalassolituus oleivorans]|uniref:hypothetical protein n=1 Tax=Thalassolituus oleivorans TaxID=187493 RepID=UPI0024095AC4|nr:hypothetical protein [Thalassolituus oleivorans]MDF1639529.1 hypothetical protein [Thalassolituus oleivorans]
MITLLSFYRGECSDIQGLSLDERLGIAAKQWQELDTLLPWLFPCGAETKGALGLSESEIRQFVFDAEATSGLYDMLRTVLPLFGITFWDSAQGYAAEVHAEQLAEAEISARCALYLPGVVITLQRLGLGAQQQALVAALQTYANDYADTAAANVLAMIEEIVKQTDGQ